MSFQGKENFEYARHINSEANTFPPVNHHLKQAAFRAVINRAYYGTFLESREFLSVSNTRRSVHGEVKDAISSKDTRIGNDYSALLRLRKKADYNINATVVTNDSRESLRLASKILRYIDTEKTS